MIIRRIIDKFVHRLASGSKLPAPIILDNDSTAAFHKYLAAKRVRGTSLTGLYNAETGQVVFGFPSHEDLARNKQLLTEDKKLKPQWYGFRCYVKQADALDISPESAVFGKVPEKHLADFKKVMERLFSPEYGTAIAYRYYESEPPERPISVPVIQPPIPAPIPVRSGKESPLATMIKLVSGAGEESEFFRNIVVALVDHCLASGDNIDQAITDLKNNPAIKFRTFQDSLDVVMVYLLSVLTGLQRVRPGQAALLRTALLTENNISAIFGITR